MSKYRKMQLLKIIDGAIETVEEMSRPPVTIIKDEKGYRKLLTQLQDAYIGALDKKQKEALTDCIQYLVDLKENNFTEEDAKYIKKILRTRLGAELPSLLEAAVLELHGKIYKFGINEVARSSKMKLSFDVQDKDAAGILGNQNLFWVGNHYDEKLSKDFDEILSGYFEGDKTIQEIADDFEIRFKDRIDTSESYFEGLAEHAVNRTRELGKVTGYEKAGIITYEIVAILDDHTSEICEEMNGKKFTVEQAVKFRDDILGAKSPEEIKDIAPWRKPEEIKGLSAEELPPGMELPPYHFRCRTQTVAHFE